MHVATPDARKRRSNEPCIYVFYGYPDTNRGDGAITLGLLTLLSKVAPQADIKVVEYSAGQQQLVANGEGAISYRLLRKPRCKKIDYICTLWAMLTGTPLRKAYLAMPNASKEDIVVVNGGHLFFWFAPSKIGVKRALRQLIRILNFWQPVTAMRQRGLRLFVLGQSVGPIQGTVGRMLLRGVWNEAELVSLRESMSMKGARLLVGPDTHVVVGPDLAVFWAKLAAERLSEADLLNTRKRWGLPKQFIAITVRRSLAAGGLSLPEAESVALTRELGCVLGSVIRSTGLRLVFVPHVTLREAGYEEDDVKVAIEVVKAIPPSEQKYTTVLTDAPSLVDVLAIYKQAELVIGMRYHSLVFGACCLTPPIGIVLSGTGTKIRGSMCDWGLRKYVLEWEREQFTELPKLCTMALSERSKLVRVMNERMELLSQNLVSAMKQRLGGFGT